MAKGQANGTIKRIIVEKGFGFIEDAGGSEFFFHRSQTTTPFEALREGQAVEFTAEEGQKGPRAVGVVGR